MAKYNVTRIAPDGFLHHQGFAEVQESLGWSLASFGHEVSNTYNWFSEQQETNIILGAELLADFQRIPKNSILYNLEQPSHPHMAKVRRLAKESGCQVWDYSHRSIAEWKSEGIDAVHVPIGYTPNLTRIQHSEPDIDVLFVGWITERRRSIIDQLKSSGINVYSSASCYGGARDNLISRSKVVLNVHHDGRDRFEIVRCSYLMANAKCIVTESSSDQDEYQDLKGLTTVPYRLLVDLCRSMVNSHEERLRMQEAAMESIRQRDLTVSVQSALDKEFPSIPTVSVPSIIQHKMQRVQEKRSYLQEGRDLRRKRDPRVQTRYTQAATVGDMKDFAPWMRDHAKGNIVEIGVRDGASTSAFLSGVEEHGGHVWSIDVQPCGHLFESHPQWSFLQCNSTDIDAMCKFIPFEIDVLLIDGDHSRAGIIADFEYARQVRAGGIILLHDIAPEEKPEGCHDMSWPGDDVKRVYKELCARLPEGWTHEELPGKYGMGVLHKPPMVPPPYIETSPGWDASKNLPSYDLDKAKEKFRTTSELMAMKIDDINKYGMDLTDQKLGQK